MKTAEAVEKGEKTAFTMNREEARRPVTHKKNPDRGRRSELTRRKKREGKEKAKNGRE